MSGKAYTMKEMRGIVEYLTQNKAFSEIKGRKMWINFANSQETKRTWQSLKETFLKRILPDIQNPYYELTLDQILSFKEGVDFEARAKNKLEIITLSDDPINNAENNNQNDNAKPSTSNNDSEDKTSGENNKGSQISTPTKSSAGTKVVGQCYKTAEDIQRDLESPKLNKIESKAAEVSDSINQSSKSLRDFITYSEPLTPMLQELLDDFASEEESERDSPNKIAKGRIIDKPSDAPIDAPKSETVENAKDPCPSKSTAVEPSNEKEHSQHLFTEALSVNNTENVMIENGDDNMANTNTSNQVEIDVAEENVTSCIPQDSEIPIIEINDSEDASGEVTVPDPLATNRTQDIVPKANENATQNCSHTTSDSVLPNNPEAFNKTPVNIQAPKQNGETEDLTDTKKDRNIESRKRSNSNNEDYSEIEKKKQRCDNETPIESVQDQTSSIIEINSQMDDSNDVTENLPIMQTSKIEETVKSNSIITNVNELKTNAQLIEGDNSKDDNGKEIINPCLQSVSLYAEQFNISKDNDTDDNEHNIANATTHIENEKQEIPQSENKLVLNTHSESETDRLEEPGKNKNLVTCMSTKVKKDKALANMFGFSTGGVTKSRKRPSKYKKKISHQYDRISNSIDSTEMTTDSDSESFISPPRGRKNKHTRKYLKPESSRVVSLEEEGGLFVMSGMKIFPLIKDGKVLKNYLTYLPSSDKDEDESYWKLKYVEERKKSEDLAKLLEQYNKEPVIEPTSPILQQSTSRTSATNLSKQLIQNDSIGPDQAVVKDCEVEHKQDNIKLKFTLNNEEVQLEGQWSNINPALDKVMQILNSNKSKERAPEPDPKPEVINNGISTPLVLTPVDIVVRKKIDIIENEIFKEIAERDREETVIGEQSKDKVQTETLKEIKAKDIQEIDDKDIEVIDERDIVVIDDKDIEVLDEKDKEEIEKKDKEEIFVTTRRERKPKSFVTPFSSPTPQSPAKKKQTPKVTKIKEPPKSIKKRPTTVPDDNIISDATKKRPRTSTKVLSETPNNETRSLRTRKSNVKETTESNIVSEDNSDERYMFPSKMSTRLSTSRSEKNIQKKSKR